MSFDMTKVCWRIFNVYFLCQCKGTWVLLFWFQMMEAKSPNPHSQSMALKITSLCQIYMEPDFFFIIVAQFCQKIKMFIMISQCRGYLKLWDCFLMLLILTYSVPSGFQLCQDMSDSGEFLLVLLESLVQFHQSPKSSFQLMWWVHFTAGVYSSPHKENTLLVEDRWVEYALIFHFHCSCTVGVKHNLRVVPPKWCQSHSASEHVGLLPWSLPATAFTSRAGQLQLLSGKAPRTGQGGRSSEPLILWVWQVLLMALVSCLFGAWQRSLSLPISYSTYALLGISK